MNIKYDRDSGKLVKMDTLSRIPVKSSYGPEDLDIDFKRDIGEVGEYPYTRGIFPEMYRKRLWLKSQVSCYFDPKDTNKAFKEFIKSGQTGLRLLAETTTHSSVDPDHPLGKYTVACNGNALFAITEYRDMLADIPLENVDIENGCAQAGGSYWTCLFLIALMEERNEDISNLRGTNINDPIHAAIISGCPEFFDNNNELGKKINADLIEFGAKYTPKWSPCTPCGYDMRESGITAIQELAFCIANAIQYYGDAINLRGVKLDDFKPMAFSQSIESDLFETVAKFRALRRVWAKVAKERLGAKKPRSMACRIGARIAGDTIGYREKPINHLARVTLQALAAVLGGTQSIDMAGYDEAFGLPSEEGRVFGLDMQHIIAHESNAALVADPLGGSYYVESLTSTIEKEVFKLLEEIDGIGGMWEALRTGWLQKQFDMSTYTLQKEIDDQKKLIIGVNAFKGPDGPISKRIQKDSYSVPSDNVRNQAIIKVKKLREERDQKKIVDALTYMYETEKKGENIIRAGIEAAKAYATVGELVGIIRLAHGFPYDHFRMIATPDYLQHLE